MARSRVGPLALGSTIIGLLIGAALIVGMPPSSAGGTPRLQHYRDAAQVDRSGPPPMIPGTVEWQFSEPQPDWKPGLPFPGSKMADLERTTDALRVTLSEGSRIPVSSDTNPGVLFPLWVPRILVGPPAGGIYVDLPDWRREEWAYVVVRARTSSSVYSMFIGLNPREGVLPAGATQPSPFAVFVATFQARGGVTPIVRDGLVHTVLISSPW